MESCRTHFKSAENYRYNRRPMNKSISSYLEVLDLYWFIWLFFTSNLFLNKSASFKTFNRTFADWTVIYIFTYLKTIHLDYNWFESNWLEFNQRVGLHTYWYLSNWLTELALMNFEISYFCAIDFGLYSELPIS